MDALRKWAAVWAVGFSLTQPLMAHDASGDAHAAHGMQMDMAGGKGGMGGMNMGAAAAKPTKAPLATGAAFGLGALLVHGLVDFNFHIPANAAIAAILAGILFGASWNGRS